MKISLIGSPVIVSVIIPVFNDYQGLEKCLESLYNQTASLDFYEVVVVDNNSDDIPEVSIFNKYKNIKFLKEIKKGSYAARNTGIKNSAGHFLAFIDSDCIARSDWIENGLKSLKNNFIVGGEVKILRRTGCDNISEAFEGLTAFPQKLYINKYKFSGAGNMFCHKKVFEAVGFFDESLFSGGDREWGRRAYSYNYNTVYDQDIVVWHPPRSSSEEQLKKNERIIYGILSKKECSHPKLDKIIGRKNYIFVSLLKNHLYKIKCILKSEYNILCKIRLLKYSLFLLQKSVAFVYRVK